MSSLDAAVFEDAGRLQEWLVSHQRTPYVDFEILTVTLSDGALEVDPMGDLKSLMPLLERFGQAHGYDVAPFDVETGTVSLKKASLRNASGPDGWMSDGDVRR